MKVFAAWPMDDAEREAVLAAWPTADVVFAEGRDASQLAAELADVDVIVGVMASVSPEVLAAAGSLRLVHLIGHGSDGVDASGAAEQLRSRGIPVARAAAASTAMAEFAVMAMIALTRRIIPLHIALAERGDWSRDLLKRRGSGALGGELLGASLALVGYGGIGAEIHRLATAFGMRVGAVSRDPDRLRDTGLDRVVDWSELPSLLAQSEFVVVSLPLIEATRHIIGRDAIDAIPRGGFLVNVGRGGVVDEDALAQALETGALAGAALDVFEHELTAGRTGHPVAVPMRHGNVILTPHIAGATRETVLRALDIVADNLRRLEEGRPLRNLVA